MEIVLAVSVDPPFDDVYVKAAADCTVDAVDAESFVLSCDDAEHGAYALTATLSGGPADLAPPMLVGDAVALDYTYTPPGHHQQATTFLVLQDPARAHLSWAAVAFVGGVGSHPGRIEEIGDVIGDLDLAVDESVCAPADCGEPMQRLGIRVSDAHGNEVTVMDADRQKVAWPGLDLDLWVGTARTSACLNVGDTYYLLMATGP